MSNDWQDNRMRKKDSEKSKCFVMKLVRGFLETMEQWFADIVWKG